MSTRDKLRLHLLRLHLHGISSAAHSDTQRGFGNSALTLGVALGLAALALTASALPAFAGAATTISAADSRSYTAGGKSDPQLRVAEFETHSGQYLDALAILTQLRDATKGKPAAKHVNQLLAKASTAYGLPAQATSLYQQAIAHDDAADTRQGRLNLARQLYEHGEPQQAMALLQGLGHDLSAKQFAERDSLMGRIWLQLGQDKKAATALERARHHGPHRMFSYYNLGVAQLRSGDTKAGLETLNDLGVADIDNDTQLALRDRANVVLGYYYLKHHKPPQAMDVFNRVQFHGPYSNRALLGLGWAYLASSRDALEAQIKSYRKSSTAKFNQLPDEMGSLIRPGFLDWAYEQRERIAMVQRIQEVKKTHRNDLALESALLPWSQLLKRDPMDTAVQEGMMAVPYALENSGAHQQALSYYKKAIKTLQHTRGRIAHARQKIKSNRMIDTMIAADAKAQNGWNWRLLDLPDAVETFYLQRTIAEYPFQESLKNYRDLNQLEDVLRDASDTLGALLHSAPGNRGTAPVHVAIAAARAKAEPAKSSTTAPVGLKLSTQLGAGGPAQARVANPDTGAGVAGHRGGLADLSMVKAPPKGFSGAPQQLAGTRAAITALLPKLAKARAESAQRLQAIALSTLAAQDATAKKYLIEVRLAVARIYDSHNTAAEPTP